MTEENPTEFTPNDHHREIVEKATFKFIEMLKDEPPQVAVFAIKALVDTFEEATGIDIKSSEIVMDKNKK